MRYTLSTMLEVIKQDLGIRDLPLPVDDKDLLRRLELSALNEFSQRYPKIVTFLISEDDRVSPDLDSSWDINKTTGYHTDEYGDFRTKYKLPIHKLGGSDIIGITNVYQGRPNGYADFFVPQGYYSDPISVMTSIADIRMAATINNSMARSMTFEFEKPYYLYVSNGWTGGIYTVRARVTHDISLSTVPDTAMTNLRKLCRYDLEAYLYGLLKRRNSIDTGVGTIDLKIDDWSDSLNKFDELLNMWDEEGANLDVDDIFYF